MIPNVLMELYLGSQQGVAYTKKDVVIPDLILAEFFAVLLRDVDRTTATKWFKKLARYAVSVDKGTLRNAMEFKHRHRKRRISFFDAVGYVFARKYGMPFVTGDKEFREMKGVEFLQK